jgi:4-carboxymuconolactone decarboxylase
MQMIHEIKSIALKLFMAIMMLANSLVMSAEAQSASEKLSAQEQSMVKIAALTAIGDLQKLSKALHDGLDAGLTVNEIKEVLVHLYAYCGFPRSIRGLQTFMEVLKEREARGIKDIIGKDASPITAEGNKYERGKKILGELTQTPQSNTLTGYGAFAPVIDTFLKEHLFADIFERDVLTYAQRELVTISVISAIGGAEPMLRSHFSLSLNVGITPDQLKHFGRVIEPAVGKEKADAAQVILLEVLQNRSRN